MIGKGWSTSMATARWVASRCNPLSVVVWLCGRGCVGGVVVVVVVVVIAVVLGVLGVLGVFVEVG